MSLAMTTTTNHTPASLLALHQQDPRKLDALAHEAIMRESVAWEDGEPVVYYKIEGTGADAYSAIPDYSASLDAAALLEARLAERGLSKRFNAALFYDVLDVFPVDDNYEFNEDAVDKAIHATAAQRTIAAILAAQEAK